MSTDIKGLLFGASLGVAVIFSAVAAHWSAWALVGSAVCLLISAALWHSEFGGGR